MIYRKKPDRIEAVQMPSGRAGNFSSMPVWLVEALGPGGVVRYIADEIFEVHTRHAGVMIGNAGDYVTRTLEGVLGLVARDEFEEAWERAA